MSQKQSDHPRAPKLPELWVLRHGETEWNRAGRLQGQLDSPLTQTGMAQARAQGHILMRFGLPPGTSLVTSPAGRARRTTEIVNEILGLEVQIDTALVEINMGIWQGETVTSLSNAQPGLPIENDPHLWKFEAPEGETLQDMTARVRKALNRLQGPTVIVTHGVTSRLLRCIALGLNPEALSSLPGGQGIVHHVKDVKASVLTT